jgi:hypothetical protein
MLRFSTFVSALVPNPSKERGIAVHSLQNNRLNSGGNYSVYANCFNITKLWPYSVFTDTDWGVCSWPWHLFALGKTDHPLFVISNRYIPVGWSAVVFCACEIIQLFSVVFCVIRAVHEFDFRLVINETSSIWRPVLVKKNYVKQW